MSVYGSNFNYGLSPYYKDDYDLATFSGTPVFGFSPLTVQFTVDVAPSVTPVSYAWDFGDTGTSEEMNPSHMYTVTGVYDVSVTITYEDTSFDIITKTDYITVYPAGLYPFRTNRSFTVGITELAETMDTDGN